MTDAERAALHRDLLQLAGYTNIVTRKGWFDDPEFGARELEYLFDEDKYEAAPALTIDWLFSLLPDDLIVCFSYLRYTKEHTVEIERYEMVYADTLRDALALAVRDYRKAAGNGNP